MLVEEQLIAAVSGYGRGDAEEVVASCSVGTCLAPPLFDEGGMGLDISVGIGEARRDVSRKERRQSTASGWVVSHDSLGPLRGHNKHGTYPVFVCVGGPGCVGPGAGRIT